MSSYSRVKSKWINLTLVIFVWGRIFMVVHAKCHFAFHTLDLCARAKRITICMIVDCRRCNKKRYPIKRSNEKRLPVQRCFIRPPFEKDPIKGSFFLCRGNFPSALKVYGDNKKSRDAFHPNWSAAGLSSAQTWQCIYSAMHEVKPLVGYFA